jgi:hypothetical protein
VKSHRTSTATLEGRLGRRQANAFGTAVATMAQPTTPPPNSAAGVTRPASRPATMPMRGLILILGLTALALLIVVAPTLRDETRAASDERDWQTAAATGTKEGIERYLQRSRPRYWPSSCLP